MFPESDVFPCPLAAAAYERRTRLPLRKTRATSEAEPPTSPLKLRLHPNYEDENRCADEKHRRQNDSGHENAPPLTLT